MVLARTVPGVFRGASSPPPVTIRAQPLVSQAGGRTSGPRLAAVILQVALSAVAGLLVWAGVGVPLGWLVVMAALFVLPGANLSRWLGVCTGPPALIVGIPLGLGAQLPLFSVAVLLHAPAPSWGVMAIALGAATVFLPTRAGMIRAIELRLTTRQAALLLVLIVAGVVAVGLSGRDSDDWTYGADIADYQAGYRLAASDPVLGADIPMIPRERLDIWIGGLGAAARASNVDIPSLLQDQLPIIVAAGSLLATYILGALIGGAASWGVVAVFVELAWLALMTAWPLLGDAFLTRVGQDKVAVALLVAPAAFAALLAAERGMSRASIFILSVLVGFGVAGVHPVTHAIVFAVLFMWAGLGTIFEDTGSRVRWSVVAGFSVGGLVAVYGLLASRGLGPAIGTPLADELTQLAVSITAGKDAIWRRLPGVILNPNVVRDALTVPLAALALVAYVIRRDSRTALVAACVIAVVGLAFDPLITPLISTVLGDSYGLGLLIRIPWLLPVPFALGALALAWRERTGAHLPLAPFVAGVLVAAMCVSSLPAAFHSWQVRHETTWRALAGTTPLFDAVRARASTDDVALVPKPIEFRIGAYVPAIKLLADRGAIGTIPHFPRARVDEAVARVDAVEAFYSKDHPPDWTTDDLATMRTYAVRFVVLATDDPRSADASSQPYLERIASGGGFEAYLVTGTP